MTRRSFLLGASLLAGTRHARVFGRARLDVQSAGTARWRSGRPRTVRIGVFSLFHPAAVTARAAGAGMLRLSAGQHTSMLRGADEARLLAARGAIRIEHAHSTFEAASVRIGTGTDESGVTLGVPGQISRIFRGSVEVLAAGNELIPIVALDLETAVASVVAAELPSSTPHAALAAQAIAARSYFVAAAGRHDAFDFCDTTHCQFLREAPGDDGPSWAGARETTDLVLAFRGSPLAALYSSSCGGRTRSLAEAGMTDEGYPYFAVECPYCSAHAAQWETRLPLDAATERLATERTEAARLAVVRRDGSSAVPGSHFATSREGDTLVVRGRGAGHGIGLCQSGAADMARRGAAFSDILRHYYPGTTLANAVR